MNKADKAAQERVTKALAYQKRQEELAAARKAAEDAEAEKRAKAARRIDQKVRRTGGGR
jgi:hypothetical protein